MLEQLWYQKNRWYWFLAPFSWLYQFICFVRRIILTRFLQQKFVVPVVVVGNITVGGVGKTPLVMALANTLVSRGLHVGIVSRGYGATIRTFPHQVTKDCQAALVGDEPLLIAKRTACPVIIDPKRVRAIHYLLKSHDCDVIISDDGLQHYAMGRAIELVVIDGLRVFGNGWCLPAGPLREPSKRMLHSDFIVINGAENNVAGLLDGVVKKYVMVLQSGSLVNMVTGTSCPLASIKVPVAAVAGIGNPQQFFASLNRLGLVVHAYPFPDHYCYTPESLHFTEEIVIMTEKDAVKCQQFARANWYYLPVEARLSEEFWQAFYAHPQIARLLS